MFESMTEHFPSQAPVSAQERGPEQLPQKEEIRHTFERLLKGNKYEEVREKSDDLGITVYEIKTTAEDGNKIEYNYQRSQYDHRNPDLPDLMRCSASIHRTEYDGEMPVSGDRIANYLDGSWTYFE